MTIQLTLSLNFIRCIFIQCSLCTYASNNYVFPVSDICKTRKMIKQKQITVEGKENIIFCLKKNSNIATGY